MNLTVSGLIGPITRLTARLDGLSHTFPDDIRVVLVGPAGQNIALMANVGGDVDVVGLNLSFEDGATPIPDASALTSGTYSPTVLGGGSEILPPAPLPPHGNTFAGFNGTNPNGIWKLFVFDDSSSDRGTLNGFSVTITSTTNAQPPTGLVASSIVGNGVTLRWSAPALSPPPTAYLLEGGATPGGVLASIPTGSASPIFSLSVPSGSFFLRVRTVSGASISLPSNEIPIHVNVPVVPSAPAGLLGLVNGSTLSLAWRNTFAGGPLGALLLDVTGSATASIPLGLTDVAAFGGVPGGTYTLSVRAANGAGVSGPSNALTVTIPGGCSGAPQPPQNFLAFKIGSTINVQWDPASTGPAPTGFVLNVSGSFVGSFPVAGRAISGAVAPGTYGLSVFAANICGISAATPVQTVVIP